MNRSCLQMFFVIGYSIQISTYRQKYHTITFTCRTIPFHSYNDIYFKLSGVIKYARMGEKLIM